MSNPFHKHRRRPVTDVFSRAVFIHICADGTISYRKQHEKVFNRLALPVFSVDTEEQAQEIQTLFGRKQYVAHPQLPGQPWYRWTDFTGNVDDLDAITERIQRDYWDKRARPEVNFAENQQRHDAAGAALIEQFGGEYSLMPSSDMLLLRVDYLLAIKEGCTASEYGRRIGTGNLQSYVRTLRPKA